MSLKKKMVRALVIAAFVSALVYAALIFLSDGPAVAVALTGFSVPLFALMLLLGLVGYLVRAWRWGRYLALAGHPVSLADAVSVQMVGQTMSISPGRVGEMLKAWLSREASGLPVSRGIALVFAERVADLIAVCLLSLGGLSVLGGGSAWMLGALGLIAAGTAVASSQWFHRLALRVLSRQSWVRKHEASAQSISETIRLALSIRTLWWSVLVSVVAWGLEGIGFALCLRELGFSSLGTAGAVSVYAVATIIGAFTFLPGGIGPTEASMAGVLVALGMGASAASAATLLVRVATLWWGVALGWIAFAVRPDLLRGLLSDEAAQREVCEE